MTAASRAAHFVESHLFATIRSVVRVRSVGAAHPFPTVAGHIERAVRTRSFGQAADVAEVVPTRAIVRARCIGLIITPWISSTVRTAGGLFPLRFGRQP